ncbi:MAG: hypothetical protein R3C15_10230 [Thermoleophilia bacterium]
MASTERGDELVLVDLRDRPEVAQTLGPLAGSASWASDGGEVAWCASRGSTSLVALDGEARRTVDGCDVRLAGGRVLTRPDELFAKEVLLDGAAYLDQEEIAAALPGDASDLVSVLGYDEAPAGLLALVVVGVGRADFVQQLQLWRGESLERTLELGRSPRAVVANVGDFGFAGKAVRLGPTGREVAIGPPSHGLVRTTLVDLATGARVLLPPARSLDWSPDGRWLALAEADAVRVYGGERTSHVYALPLEAGSLAWRE